MWGEPVKEWAEKINASKDFEEAAATWEGDICFVFDAQPDKGLPKELWTWMDLWHGKCRDYRYDLSPEEGAKARFVMRAPYARWKDVVTKKLDPIKGLMMGKIKPRATP